MRGEATRLALIRAAIDIFGREGYKAATTNEIARTADANQALISYYYGGKEGLYRAVVEHIVRRIDARTQALAERVDALLLPAVEAGPGAASGLEQRSRELLFEILDGLAEFLTDSESAAWARIIVTEQREPTQAFEALYAAEERLLEVMARLVAAIRGRIRPSPEDRLTVLSILGEALVFRTARAAVLRFMGWKGLRAEQVGCIKQALRRNAAALLEEDAGRGGKG